MPLIVDKELPGARLGVWRIGEDETELKTMAPLPPEDIELAASWKNESRRKQWLCCRAIISRLSGLSPVKVSYDEHGKPSLHGFKGQISITHTSTYAAVLLSEKESAGLDIEQLSPRLERVAGRFLQDEELEYVSRVTCHVPCEENRPGTYTELLGIYWSAKEALYKFYGKPSVDLKNDIYIIPFDYFCNSQATFEARVKTPEGVQNHELRFERIDDHVLVYTLSKQA